MSRSRRQAQHSMMVRLDPVAVQMLKIHGLDKRVTVGQLIRDALTTWLGYATPVDDPRFAPQYIGGERPYIVERYPGYAARIDVFAPAEDIA